MSSWRRCVRLSSVALVTLGCGGDAWTAAGNNAGGLDSRSAGSGGGDFGGIGFGGSTHAAAGRSETWAGSGGSAGTWGHANSVAGHATEANGVAGSSLPPGTGSSPDADEVGGSSPTGNGLAGVPIANNPDLGGLPGGGGLTAGNIAAGASPGSAAGGADCDGARIDAVRATAIYTEYAFRVQPRLNPLASFSAEEQTVEGLWEHLQAQLFDAKAFAEDGTLWRECFFLYNQCQITLPQDGCFFGVLDSGVVAKGAFYYSWGSGSGIYRSEIGKMSPGATGLVRTVSPAYKNPSSAPPGLVVQESGGELLVYRAFASAFNVWSASELIGSLRDFGDRLAVVDSTGQEISSTLDP